jgi:hypothetical protein
VNKGLQGPLTDTLKQYDDLFREPKGLPPVRSHDNSTPLKEGVHPISVSLYRYHFYQKEEIKKIVRDLLESGVIRHSHSHLSSLFYW